MRETAGGYSLVATDLLWVCQNLFGARGRRRETCSHRGEDFLDAMPIFNFRSLLPVLSRSTFSCELARTLSTKGKLKLKI